MASNGNVCIDNTAAAADSAIIYLGIWMFGE